MIDTIRDYFKRCPILEAQRISVDFLKEKGASYAIAPASAPLILKRYAGGDTLRQFVFCFRFRAPYGITDTQSVENSGLFEHLAAWLEEQSEGGSLPDLGKKKIALKLEAVQSGQLIKTQTDTAVYEIKCRLIYYQPCP